ncbi:MAG: type II toxin-antitoxin system Phd/YefM family antitoxin [Chloroflexi bacterium]|nr:type II toxin-antitoxin system Phd/YefM family antitoxin [Chloroflexota bacterium]
MIELMRVPQTVSMNDIKNRTASVTAKFTEGPVVLMNRGTPQAVLVSPQQWNAILDSLEEMQDAILTLQTELEIATGQNRVETVGDIDAFISEILYKDEPVSA